MRDYLLVIAIFTVVASLDAWAYSAARYPERRHWYYQWPLGGGFAALIRFPPRCHCKLIRRKELALFIAAAVFAATLLAAAVQFTGDHTRSDFMLFYAAGKLVLHGQGAELYRVGPEAGALGWYNHAPAEALLFAPLAHFRYSTAFFLWLCINLLLLATSIFLLRHWIRLLSTWDLLLLLAVVAIPIFSALWNGQDSFLSLLLYAGTFRSLESGKKFTAGALLAMGLYKPQLILPFVALAAVRYGWRFCSGFAAGGVGFVALSVAAAGLRTTLRFPFVLLSYARSTSFGGYHPWPGTMPNLRGFAYSFFPVGARMPLIDLTVILASVLLLLVLAALPIKKSGGFAFAVLASLLVSWHLTVADFSLIFLPAVLLLGPTFRYPYLLRSSLVMVIGGLLLAFRWQPAEFASASYGMVVLVFGYFSARAWELLHAARASRRGIAGSVSEE